MGFWDLWFSQTWLDLLYILWHWIFRSIKRCPLDWTLVMSYIFNIYKGLSGNKVIQLGNSSSRENSKQAPTKWSGIVWIRCKKREGLMKIWYFLLKANLFNSSSCKQSSQFLVVGLILLLLVLLSTCLMYFLFYFCIFCSFEEGLVYKNVSFTAVTVHLKLYVVCRVNNGNRNVITTER